MVDIAGIRAAEEVEYNSLRLRLFETVTEEEVWSAGGTDDPDRYWSVSLKRIEQANGLGEKRTVYRGHVSRDTSADGETWASTGLAADTAGEAIARAAECFWQFTPAEYWRVELKRAQEQVETLRPDYEEALAEEQKCAEYLAQATEAREAEEARR